MNRQQRIYQTLKESLDPSVLEVVDDSDKHAGHAGASPAGQTHYTVTITADRFTKESTVTCHRIIYGLLDHEFNSGLHALAIHVKK